MNYEAVKEELRNGIYAQVDLSREVEDEELSRLIHEAVMNKSRDTCIPVEERTRLYQELFNSMRKLDILQALVDDPDITEIMVNGPKHIFYEKKGELFLWNFCFDSLHRLEDVIQQIAAKSNRMINEASPIVDARLEDGSRVNAVLQPVALNGPILTIRRFPEKPLLMEDLIRLGALDEAVAEFLKRLVGAGYNIFISGGTGSGKTTFLNALSGLIPKEERIITIEDSAELQLQGISNLVRLETRNANVEGCREITIRDLIRTSLRMRPDRIIVGEVRGEEAVDLLTAMNTGHSGSLSTGHSNSSKDMLSRLETMVLMGMEFPLAAVRRQIASGIDILIHLGRMRDRSRKLLEIVEILGYENGEIQLSPLYAFEETGEEKNGKISGVWKQTGELFHTRKLEEAGIF